MSSTHFDPPGTFCPAIKSVPLDPPVQHSNQSPKHLLSSTRIGISSTSCPSRKSVVHVLPIWHSNRYPRFFLFGTQISPTPQFHPDPVADVKSRQNQALRHQKPSEVSRERNSSGSKGKAISIGVGLTSTSARASALMVIRCSSGGPSTPLELQTVYVWPL